MRVTLDAVAQKSSGQVSLGLAPFRSFLASLVLLLWVTNICSGQQLHVDGALTTNGNGVTWGSAFNNLQSALDVVQTGQQIWVKPSVYRPSTSSTPGLPRTHTFAIPASVEVYGGFDGTETTVHDRTGDLYRSTVLSGDIALTPAVRADDVYTVVTMQGGSLLRTLDGFVIELGNATETPTAVTAQQRGGGIYIEDANVRVRNCTFINNRAIRGGGLYFANWNPQLENFGLEVVLCAFWGNSALEHGGGIGLYQAGASSQVPVSHIFNCYFESNIAGSSNWFEAHDGGAGVYVENRAVPADTTLHIYNSVFTNNLARSGSGGGIFLRGGETVPAMYADKVTIRNCTITENSSHAIGLVAQNDDQPYPGGAGVFVESGYAQSLIANCIIWNNTGSVNPADLSGPGTRTGGADSLTAIPVRYTDLYYELPTGFPPSSPAHPGVGNIALDPLFVAPGAQNFHLQASSPCLDTANSDQIANDYPDFSMNGPFLDPTPIDFAGNPRDVDYPGATGGVSSPSTPPDVIVDMGAFERQAP